MLVLNKLLVDVVSVNYHFLENGLVLETLLVVRIGLVGKQQEDILILNMVRVVAFLGYPVFFYMVLIDFVSVIYHVLENGLISETLLVVRTDLVC
jgi:hypothetical protein